MATSAQYPITHSPEPDRVRANTWPAVNDGLDRQARARIEYASTTGNFSRPIAELGREWDFERVTEAEASSMGLLGVALGVAVSPRFLVIPVFVTAMLLLHANQGWYPLLPLFRRAGVRTQDEIDREYYAMKALRGDFEWLKESDTPADRAAAAWRAVCA